MQKAAPKLERLLKKARNWSAPKAGYLSGLDIGDGSLAAATVELGIEHDLLTLVEGPDAGALKSRGVNENVVATAIGSDKAVTFLRIVELDCA